IFSFLLFILSIFGITEIYYISLSPNSSSIDYVILLFPNDTLPVQVHSLPVKSNCRYLLLLVLPLVTIPSSFHLSKYKQKRHLAFETSFYCDRILVLKGDQFLLLLLSHSYSFQIEYDFLFVQFGLKMHDVLLLLIAQ